MAILALGECGHGKPYGEDAMLSLGHKVAQCSCTLPRSPAEGGSKGLWKACYAQGLVHYIILAAT